MNVIKLVRKKELAMLKTHTPIFGILSTKTNVEKDWLDVGRLYERSALILERAGIQTAVSAVPPEADRLREALKSDYRPQIFFRIGYAEKAAPHSPRLASDKVTEINGI